MSERKENLFTVKLIALAMTHPDFTDQLHRDAHCDENYLDLLSCNSSHNVLTCNS